MRYPLEPLATALNIDLAGEDPTAQLAMRIGVARRAVQEARRMGLSDLQADLWAITVGLHPGAIWGRIWWDAAPAELRKPEAPYRRPRGLHTHRLAGMRS